jgi:hypothetical protein
MSNYSYVLPLSNARNLTLTGSLNETTYCKSKPLDEYIKDELSILVKEECTLLINPNLYLTSVLTDKFKLKLDKLLEAKTLLQQKVTKC